MATLTVFRFEREGGAAQAVSLIEKLQKQALIQLHDAAIVTWPIGSKKPKTTHLSHMTGRGALDGAFWGMLFGMIFFVPFFGMAIGAAMGALSGKFRDYGINDDFIKSIRERVTEGTSAVFLLTSGAVKDKVIEAARSLPKFELITSNLSDEQEAALREAFSGELKAAAPGAVIKAHEHPPREESRVAERFWGGTAVNRASGVLVVALLASIRPGLRVADAHSPSLNETLNWLKEEIDTKATNGGSGACVSGGIFALPCSWRYEATGFSGCEVSWAFTETSHAHHSFESGTKEEITMPLWEDFSPAPFASSGEGETWRVFIQLKDLSSQKSRVKRTLTLGSTTSVSVETRSFAQIRFGIPGEDNKDAARRFAKAFSHAVQLCQSRKPKPKEPF